MRTNFSWGANIAVLSVVTLMGAAPAVAQAPKAQAPTAPTQPHAGTPGVSAQPKCSPQLDQGQQPRTEGRGGSNLSDKLASAEGVICPPQTGDREIAAPPPGGGKMPVIPPPGSPGGDPTVRPK